MRRITVLLFPVGKDPELKEIGNDLKQLQSLVGGYIEAHAIGDCLTSICNEEGRSMGLDPNRNIPLYGMIVGDFFITASDEEGDFRSLTVPEIAEAKALIARCNQ